MRAKCCTLFRLNLSDLKIGLGIVALPWLLLHLVTAGVMVVLRPDESILIGGTLLPICAALAGFSMTSAHTMVTVTSALRMSRTRREGLCLAAALSLSLSALCTALAGVLLWAERSLGMPLWRFLSGDPQLLVDDFGCWWWAVPAGAALGVALGFVYGALWLRLGQRAVWIYLGAWIAFLVLMQVLPWKTHEIVSWLIPALLVLLVLAMAWSVWSVLHLVLRE